MLGIHFPCGISKRQRGEVWLFHFSDGHDRARAPCPRDILRKSNSSAHLTSGQVPEDASDRESRSQSHSGSVSQMGTQAPSPMRMGRPGVISRSSNLS
jgi:hypothetical protein